MAILVSCPTCGKGYQMPDSAAGKCGRCRECGSAVPVPGLRAARACAACDLELTGRKRTKDAEGIYYCESCWQGRQLRCRDSAPASTPKAVLDDLAALAPVPGAEQTTRAYEPAPAKREWTGPMWISRLCDTSNLPLRQRYKVLGFRYRVGGIGLQLLPVLVVAVMMNVPAGSWLDTNAIGIASLIVMGLSGLTEIALFIAGLAYYARYKGRSPQWCVAGFLGIPGLLVLMLLQDQWVEAKPARFGR